jgi:hypothetical protein
MTCFKRAALASIALAVAACDTTPTSLAEDVQAVQASADGARRFVDEEYHDMTDNLILFACDENGNPTDESGGEVIRMRGGLYSRFVIMFTPSGHININYHTMPVGLAGTGEDSGEDFRVKVADQGMLTLTGNGASIPFHYTETLVGRDTGRTMKLVQRGMFRITDGRVLVDRVKEYVECRV